MYMWLHSVVYMAAGDLNSGTYACTYWVIFLALIKREGERGRKREGRRKEGRD